jgi:hypothetical protein
MERNNNKRPEYYGNYNGERVYFNPQNTIVYLHKDTPGADHLFVVIDKEGEAEPEQSGFYVWRAKHTEVFTQMAQDLLADGCNLVALDRVSDFDANNLANEVDEIPDGLQPLISSEGYISNPEVKEPETFTLTPRQENLAHFVAYLLLHERLSADDFRGEGPLYI